MKVNISEDAELDLAAIGSFVAKDNPVAAVKLVTELFAQCLSLESAPERGPVVGVSRGVEIRRLINGRYLILYGILGDGVRVYRIRHGAQSPAFLDDLTWRDS